MKIEPKRIRLIESGVIPLSTEEIAAGWHFCPEWDYMLIGPDDPEWEGCTCSQSETIVK